MVELVLQRHGEEALGLGSRSPFVGVQARSRIFCARVTSAVKSGTERHPSFEDDLAFALGDDRVHELDQVLSRPLLLPWTSRTMTRIARPLAWPRARCRAPRTWSRPCRTELRDAPSRLATSAATAFRRGSGYVRIVRRAMRGAGQRLHAHRVYITTDPHRVGARRRRAGARGGGRARSRDVAMAEQELPAVAPRTRATGGVRVRGPRSRRAELGGADAQAFAERVRRPAPPPRRSCRRAARERGGRRAGIRSARRRSSSPAMKVA